MGMTDAIREEWKNHQSAFAKQWRVSMFARKRVDNIAVGADHSLASLVEQVFPDEHVRAVVQKDRHLLEAALATDRRVASLDNNVREHLKRCINMLGDVGSICWVNPTSAEEAATQWLSNGAPEESHRRLDHVAA